VACGPALLLVVPGDVPDLRPSGGGGMSGQDDDAGLEVVLGKLQGVRQQGGYWMARCPHHEDRKASLSVARGTEQPVVLDCKAGCATADVLAEIGLTMADISKPREERPAGEWTPRGRATEVYDYADEDGKLLFQVCRTADKQFPQRVPDRSRKGGYRWSLGDTRRVPYRLSRLLAGIQAGKTVHIVEGERDVHAVEAVGGLATCNPGGAGKWRSEYDEFFRGADVVIVADRDKPDKHGRVPGADHAQDIAAHLRPVARSVVVVEAAEGKDARDHLAAGHRLGDFRAADGPQPAQREPVILPGIPRYPVSSVVGPLRSFVEWAAKDGLHPETAGAAGLAALATLTGPARLKLSEVKEVRAILWIALIGIPSSGKSPAFEHAFARIRERYAASYQAYESDLEGWEAQRETEGVKPGPKPVKPQPLEYDDATVEAVARWLLARYQEADNDPSGAVIDDELASTLEGLNQYKGGMGADRSKWLKLWTGADLSIQRVGRGGAQNEVHIYVRQPVVSLAGPLTDSNVHLMGKQGSGFRPRFLPHLAPAEQPAWNNAGPHPEEWTKCIDALLDNRKPRTWLLEGAALAEWSKARERWRRQQDEAEPDDVIEALRKADAQCYRIALVIAESLNPGGCGDVPVSAVECAVAIVDYVIGCWRALPGSDTMAASRADDVMDAMQARLLGWLQSRPKGTEGLPQGSKPRARATRREVQRWSHQKAENVKALLREHDARYPGCVVSVGARTGEGRGGAGGMETQYVYAPERAPIGVTATPIGQMNPTPAKAEPAGHDGSSSVSRLATPKVRDSEGATAKDKAWPPDSEGEAANRGSAA
jgi:hypothetical protein